MIFSSKKEIRGFYLESEVYFPIARNLQHVIGVSLDANYIYWSDIKKGDEAIIRSLDDGTKAEVIVSAGNNRRWSGSPTRFHEKHEGYLSRIFCYQVLDCRRK